MLESILALRGPPMHEINYLMVVCMLVTVIFKNILDMHIVGVGYVQNSLCGLSISRWLPHPLPSKEFLGWQSC